MSNEKSNFYQTSDVYLPDAKVTDFLSASQNNDPLLYPGQRPETSYLSDGKSVFNIQVENKDGTLGFTLKTEEGQAPLDEYFENNDLATMGDRIPMLAFGANMSPGSLASKLRKVGREDALVIPTVYAYLKDYDVVWSGGPGINGNFAATLYTGEETAGSEAPVGINFLTREQLLVMHATELSYVLSSTMVDVVGIAVRAYYYAGKDSVYLQDGKPVGIDSINTRNRKLKQASTTAMLDSLLADKALTQNVLAKYSDITDARSYIDLVKSLKKTPGARTTLKQTMFDTLATAGQSKTVENIVADGLSWSNPSILPTYSEQLAGIDHHHTYRLPSEEIPAWPDPAARKKVLDTIGEHYRRHK